MATLNNSNRTLLKATHTAIDLPEESLGNLNRALEKNSYVRSLSLQDGEVDRLRRSAQAAADRPSAIWDAMSSFEPSRLHATGWESGVLASVPTQDLVEFGQRLIEQRTADAVRREPRDRDVAIAGLDARGYAVDPALIGAAKSALDTFTSMLKISPVGMLHLERIEMAPAGIERGELLATIPLAPGESTAVEQKEWTVTEEDLSSIVTDSLENYTEKGVTEKSELAQATTSESKRNQQLGVSATLSGSYGFVTFSTSTSFTSALEASESKKQSVSEAKEVTSKASSRVTKERKVTIQSSTISGTSETSTRMIVNPSTTDGLRIDYFSMMRKWRVRLLQYGVRQTYDIAIPAPGASLREPLVSIAALNSQIESPYVFPVHVGDVTAATYRDLAATWGAAVPEPPSPPYSLRIGGPTPGLDHEEGWHFQSIDLDVPDNYEVSDVLLDAMLGNVDNDDPDHRAFLIFGYGPPRHDSAGNPTGDSLGQNGRASFVEDLTAMAGFLKGARGKQTIQYFIQNVNVAAVTFLVTFSPTAESEARWQTAAWQALHDAANDHHYASIQQLTAERDALIASLSSIDTLTLRREEREEIMRGVLEWLLGPSFEFMPDALAALYGSGSTPATISLTGNKLGVSDAQWATMFRYQEMIKFLHQAIEWENLLYFVYPYFWDLPSSWDFIRTLEHPDLERQQFLRAGSARVVLTVRPGFETSFAQFVDNGSFGTVLPPGHPYVTIGQEIAAYSQTNYPGVPPANPASSFRPLLSTLSRRAWGEMLDVIAKLDTWAAAHSGQYPTTADGLGVLPAAPAADPWGKPYQYACPGRFTDYELASMGPDGVAGPGPDGETDDITSWAPASLIGEWFEYTPSRGTDIAVNSVPVDLA